VLIAEEHVDAFVAPAPKVYLVLLHFLVGDTAPTKHLRFDLFAAFKEKPGAYGDLVARDDK
jgi:hypothetical protein